MTWDTDDDAIAVPEIEPVKVTIATWIRVRQDIAADCVEFIRDFSSAAMRTTVAFVAMQTLQVDRSVALSTAIILGGASIFDKTTNWGHRSRKWLHVWVEKRRKTRS